MKRKRRKIGRKRKKAERKREVKIYLHKGKKGKSCL
jgi:hypothetical protein